MDDDRIVNCPELLHAWVTLQDMLTTNRHWRTREVLCRDFRRTLIYHNELCPACRPLHLAELMAERMSR